ncbi:methyl-accepting chemotaxis protein [Pseudodesulfovibrio sp.]|uniref:methyl-accepting chemotaxis protein n=1 Tax=Pseudodesulfovibrio sp. TaxID=2035812 RepID=UPI0026238060|nr:methyl-accepting chemotaxis protein [Pseudodesulfovibrio sp.]MDD3312963.1 methyl-accepting chemotaxis protein [Pseudodesulfovibrio sp.]
MTDSTLVQAGDSAMQTAKGQAVSSASALAVFIQDQVVMAEVLAQQPSMMSAVKGSPWMAQAACGKIVKANPNLWGLAVFDKTGKVVTGANADGAELKGMDFSANEYVKKVLSGEGEKVVDSSVHKPDYAKSRIFAIGVPIKSMSGDVVGGIVLFASWDAYIRQFVEHVKIGRTGYGFVLDREGRFIHHPDAKLFGKSAEGLDFISQALAEKKTEVRYDWNGQEKLMAIATDPFSGWTVCMSVVAEDIVSTAREQALLMEIIGGGLIVVVIALLLFMLRVFVFTPIRRTMAMADETARGDLERVYEVRDGDEIARLQGALINIRRTVRALTQDFAEVAGKIEQGYLLARGRADGCEGEFARLIENTNYMLGGLVNLLDELPLPLMAISPEHTIRYINKAGAAAGDVAAASLLDTTCSAHFRTGDCKGGNCACEKAMRGKEMVFSRTQAHPGGGEMEMDYFGMPLLDSEGNVLGAMKVVMDQTEIRRAQKRMQETADQADQVATMLSAASQELTAQVGETSSGAQKQKVMTEEAATAMEQMNATIVEIARNASEAAHSAELMRGNAGKGGEVVSAVVDSIETLRGRARKVDENIRKLGGEVEAIGAIMTVITDIADQTNLLALNAAIEAARAGDAGRGFAVVADEVRKLAEKTMAATQEVGDAIQGVQNGTRRNLEAFQSATEAIDESTRLASQAGEALTDIQEMARVADDQIRNIATASEEQAATTSQLSHNVDEVNVVSDGIVGAMTESTTAVAEVARLAEDLKQIITRIGGNRG